MYNFKSEINSFLNLSFEVGKNFNFIQGAGGNSSIKLGGRLIIKASGMRLADSLKKGTFMELSLDNIKTQLGTILSDQINFSICSENQFLPLARVPQTPSIETSMHAILPSKIVIHTHSISVLSYAVREDASSIFSRLLTGLNWGLIPYARPGFPLTEEILSHLKRNKRRTPEILILKNHGLVILADSCEKAKSLLFEVERRLANKINCVRYGNLDKLKKISRNSNFIIPKDKSIHFLARSPFPINLIKKGTMYPDHVVFFRPKADSARR